MHIQVLVQTQRILHVARKRIEPGGAVPEQAESPLRGELSDLEADPERAALTGSQEAAVQAANQRLPSGHPEAFIEAFANLYRNFADSIRAKILGIEPSDIMLDFPKVEDGARGVYMIHKAVESSNSTQKWTPAAYSI